MAQVTLRSKAGETSPTDLTVTVQDKTFDYLMTATAPDIRVSAYLDQDQAQVDASYAEIWVSDECPFITTIKRVIPGSKTRRDIVLPGPMTKDEQLTLITTREPK